MRLLLQVCTATAMVVGLHVDLFNNYGKKYYSQLYLHYTLQNCMFLCSSVEDSCGLPECTVWGGDYCPLPASYGLQGEQVSLTGHP